MLLPRRRDENRSVCPVSVPSLSRGPDWLRTAASELPLRGGLSDRGGRENPSRKVRTPQGRAVGNAHPGKPAGKCHRNDTADGATAAASRTGKGEMVR